MSYRIYARTGAPARGFTLTERDRAILRSVYDHRFLDAGHVRALHFPSSGERVVQDRLRGLFLHGYVDRLARYAMALDAGAYLPRPQRPLYCLAGRGADVVADALGPSTLPIPRTVAQNLDGFRTLDHHLVVTDLFVSLTATLHGDPLLALGELVREHELRRRLYVARSHGRVRTAIVSDGAFRLVDRASGAVATYHVEVVRALVKAGNQSLRAKCERYLALHRQGFFRQVYGDDRLRAVLFLTETAARAARYRALVEGLPHGRRLFVFAHYETRTPGGCPQSRLTPASVLDLPLDSGEPGERTTLRSTFTRSP